MEQGHPTPQNIMQTGTGFWASKILLTGVKFELFTILAEKKNMSGAQIKSQLKMQCSDRHVYDWLDALTVFGFMHREGLLDTASYSNGADIDF